MDHLCGDCQEEAGVREARLKTESADRYPTLPVHMWTRAAGLADLVAAWRRKAALGRFGMDRLLLDTDFEFRGSPGATPETLHAARRLL